MDKRITFFILGMVLAASGCAQSTKNIEPVTVVSVQGVYPIVPAGPTIKIILKSNNTDVPITGLSATLSIIEKSQIYGFPKINQSHPLMPGQTASQTLVIIGPAGYVSDSTYPLHIEGKLMNGQTFSYTINVTISNSGTALKTNLIVNGSGTIANIQPPIESELKIGYNESPSRLVLTQADRYLFRGLVDSITGTDNMTYVEFSGTMGYEVGNYNSFDDYQYSANASKIDPNTWRLKITYFI